MRLSVRPPRRRSPGFSRGTTEREHPAKAGPLPALHCFSDSLHSAAQHTVKPKRNLGLPSVEPSPGSPCRHPTTQRYGNINPFPFPPHAKRISRVNHRVRTDSPTYKYSSGGTFLLFGLAVSHSNICYYHQDLHSHALQTESPPPFDARTTPSYSLATSQRAGISSPLQRHPFSGLLHSAGELLHTP